MVTFIRTSRRSGARGTLPRLTTSERSASDARATTKSPRTTSGCGVAAAHRVLDQRAERQVQMGVRRQHVAACHHVVTTSHVTDIPAGLSDEKDPGSDVPRRQREFPEAFEAAGGDIGEVEGRRTHAPNAARRAHNLTESSQVALLLRAGAKWHAGADDCLAELAASGNPQP